MYASMFEINTTTRKTLTKASIALCCMFVLAVVYNQPRGPEFMSKMFISSIDSNVFQHHEKATSNNSLKTDFLKIGQWFTEPKGKKNVNYTYSRKLVLLYNWLNWFPVDIANQSFKNCNINNCELTTNKQKIKQAGAVIFHLPQGNHRFKKPPIPRKERNTNQPWIVMYFESPVHIRINDFMEDAWMYTLNWSISYKFDADITAPYGALQVRSEPMLNKNYSSILSRKRRMAAWIVSNCHTQSKREHLANILKVNGIDVDIFGKCGKGKIENDNILDNYKFYFAFENSLCIDYITEKFFSRFNYDIILVTYGGANYKDLLPSGTFVNVADFETVQDLAMHLRHLSTNNELYGNILKEKDKFIALGPLSVRLQYGFCQLCAKLNKIDENRKVIKHISEVINKTDCDIHRKHV